MKLKTRFILSLIVSTSMMAQAQVINLQDRWTFALDPLQTGEQNGWQLPAFPSTSFDKVTVPHSFSVDPRYFLYTGTAWYFRSVEAPAIRKGFRAFLHFDAVFYKAKVWWNGQLIGTHEGGYTPFELDVTDHLKNKNTLAVSVNNAWDTTTIPGAKTADTTLPHNATSVYAWMNYGGIMRPVHLSIRPEILLQKIKVEAEPDLTKKTARIRIIAIVKNYSGAAVHPVITTKIYRDGKKITAPFRMAATNIASNGEGKIIVTGELKPAETKLWHPDEPNLYTAELILGEDTVRTNFGIRKLEAKGTKLLLNGEPIRMGGANRPADFPGYGSLEPDTVLEKDLTLMKNGGMELCRIAHYPVPDNLLNWADRHGMLIITEAGNWQMTPKQMADPAMRKNFQSQCREMIERDWNHPSVIAYSLGNEFQSQTPEGKSWVKDMSAFVKACDTTRLITFASFNVWRDYVKKPEDEASQYVDFISANIYGNHLKNLQHIHEVYPDKPVYISEFGIRAGKNKKEDDRIVYLQKAMQAIRQCDYVVGASVWSFNDYMSRYPGTDADGYRAWGLVTPQRELRGMYTAWQEEFSPAVIDTVQWGGNLLSCTITARKDFPAYTLRNYQVKIGDQIVNLPTLKPGESKQVTVRGIFNPGERIEIQLVKPGGFVVLKTTFTPRSIDTTLQAQQSIQLPYIFSDNMVLQRQKPVTIWGTGKPLFTFDISFAGKKQTIKTDRAGNWQVVFPSMEAGGPYEMAIDAGTPYTLRNIMIGDVWLCSGQSNMEWIMMKTLNAAYELQQANHPGIRFFSVPKNIASVPLSNTLPVSWKSCTPQNAYEFSAVAYFFARELNERMHIPVGIIHSSWGGTPIEAWTSIDSIRSHADFKRKADSLLLAWQQGKTIEALQQDYSAKLQEYQSTMQRLDKGYAEKWLTPGYNAANWKKMVAPGLLEQEEALFRGSVWLRKSVYIPASMLQNDLLLNLEQLNERDITYFNGQEVGRITWLAGRRSYRIPKALLKEGENLVTIRLETLTRPAGFTTKNAGDLRLEEVIASATPLSVPLAGEWQYALGLPLQQYPTAVTTTQVSATPAVLFNGMIAPLKKFPIKGVLWYQGETNAPRAFQYGSLLPLMIRDWRAQWQQPALPFLFVQLAGFGELTNNPVDHAWGELREAQLKTLSLPNTGMGVTIDVGNPADIHPINKQVVGKRLADEARKLVYGENNLQTSPLYQSMRVSGDSIRIRFSNAANGLMAKGGPPKAFSIAGADKKFVWANARIDGGEIIVWSSAVRNPLAVRYAWTGSPVESNGANLYNKEGFPASPFRTDAWPGITTGKK